MDESKLSTRWKLALAIVVCEGVGVLSGLFAGSTDNAWFDTLNKPDWNPPGYVFAPVWTTLYLLMGIALWLVWKTDSMSTLKTRAIQMFAIQLFFNFCWSILFFRVHSPGLALVDIVLMVVTIGMAIVLFYWQSRTAAWVMIPYLAWVSFASFLNYTIMTLNN